MPLDSSLFNDLIEANGHAVVSTRGMPNAYSMDTPDNAWRTMVDMWRSRAITSTRIIQDIDKTVRAMDAIIAALGTIVEDYDCRNGHRKRQARLCLAGMMHPDCEKAMQAQSVVGGRAGGGVRGPGAGGGGDPGPGARGAGGGGADSRSDGGRAALAALGGRPCPHSDGRGPLHRKRRVTVALRILRKIHTFSSE